MKWVCNLLLLTFVVGGCAVAPPVKEYTYARTALQAAKASQASKYSPGLWFQAEENYRKGENSFKKGDYEVAKKYFIESQNYAERAENKARYDKRKSGEDLP